MLAWYASATRSNIRVDVLVERIGLVRRGVGNLDLRKIARFHLLNAALDLADAFQVIREHGLVGRPQRALQILGLLRRP